MYTLGGVRWDTLRSDDEAVALIRRAVELGVNTFDTAAGYGNGESERKLGLGLRGLRDRVWVNTKIGQRDRDGARRAMDQSLDRLGMDRVDLMFVHGIGDDEDLKKASDPDGVLKAMQEYREAGRIRFVGVSGHWHRENMCRILGAFDFNAVLLPAGIFNVLYDYSYVDEVVPAARERGLAVLGMKLLGSGRALHADSVEPYVRYACHQPIDTAVMGCDSIAQLEQILRIVKNDPAPLSDAEQQDLMPEARQITQAFDEGQFDFTKFYKRRLEEKTQDT